MKTEQSPGQIWSVAATSLSTLAVLAAVAIVLFPSYSGLYDTKKFGEDGGMKKAAQLRVEPATSTRL
jgi:hypothetical protein